MLQDVAWLHKSQEVTDAQNTAQQGTATAGERGKVQMAVEAGKRLAASQLIANRQSAFAARCTDGQEEHNVPQSEATDRRSNGTTAPWCERHRNESERTLED